MDFFDILSKQVQFAKKDENMSNHTTIGIGGKCGLYKIDGNIRKLTPRECARLQGFPESFKIPTSDNLAYSTFGNAVDVCMVQLILQEIASTADIMKHLKNT